MMIGETAVVFAQVPLLKAQLEELKRRTGTTTTKDALQIAVNHYLRCSAIERSESERCGWHETNKKEDAEKNWWWSPSEREER
jgi:hypothetical protein